MILVHLPNKWETESQFSPDRGPNFPHRGIVNQTWNRNCEDNIWIAIAQEVSHCSGKGENPHSKIFMYHRIQHVRQRMYLSPVFKSPVSNLAFCFPREAWPRTCSFIIILFCSWLIAPKQGSWECRLYLHFFLFKNKYFN